ncbi:hypothetical protein HY251_05510 [bacterium]|nr:hypothetical protein [bacterium]
MEKLDFDALSGRIGNLERSTRRWKGLATACALACSLIVLGGWTPPNQKLKGEVEVVSVNVAKDGKSVAKIFVGPDGPVLQLFGSDQQGNEAVARAELRIKGEDAIMHVGCKDNPRFDVEALIRPDKGGALIFGTPRGKPIFSTPP